MSTEPEVMSTRKYEVCKPQDIEEPPSGTHLMNCKGRILSGKLADFIHCLMVGTCIIKGASRGAGLCSAQLISKLNYIRPLRQHARLQSKRAQLLRRLIMHSKIMLLEQQSYATLTLCKLSI